MSNVDWTSEALPQLEKLGNNATDYPPMQLTLLYNVFHMKFGGTLLFYYVSLIIISFDPTLYIIGFITNS